MAEISIPHKEAGDSLSASEVNTIVAGVNASSSIGHDHDDLYYTEGEIDERLGIYALTEEVEALLVNKQDAGDYATNTALTAGLATKQATGDYATNTALTTAVNNLKDGVATEGNTLAKLYALITAMNEGTTAPSVADIAARDAYSITAGQTIMVLDDGDGKWAYYFANTSGVGASYTKLSDEDTFNAVMSASAIKTSYESNPDTNAFTDSYKTALDGLAAALAAKQATLVSGTNIKTFNGQSLLGSGDITSAGGDVTNSTITSLRALTAPSDTVRYYLTDPGKEGLLCYDPADTTSTDDGALCLVSTNGKRFKRIIQNNTVNLSWFEGATDYTAIIKKLSDAGYAMEGMPGAVYPCTSLQTITDKNIVLDGKGCTFELTYTGSFGNWLQILTTPNTAHTVEAISDYNGSATSSSNNLFTNIGLGGTHGSSYIQLAGDQTGNLSRGDVVRLYATDQYITGLENATYVRKAEYFVIEQIAYDATTNKTRVAFQGSLFYSYNITANVKLCSVKPYKCILKNFNFKMKSATAIGHIYVRGYVKPVFDNITMSNLYFAGIQTKGCFEPYIVGCSFYNSENSNADGRGIATVSGANAGYAIGDGGSWGVRVDKCTFVNVRHGWTTLSRDQQTETSPWLLGETIGAVISNCVARGAAHAYDTHPDGVNIVFIGCNAENCTAAYQIRTRSTKIIGGSIIRAHTAIYIAFSSGNDGLASYRDPIVIQGVTIEQLHQDNLIAIKATSPYSFPIRIENCRISGGLIQLSYTEAKIINCEIDTRRGYAGGTEPTQQIDADNSDIKMFGCFMRSGGGSFTAFNLKGNNNVYADNLTLQTAANPRIAGGSNSNNKLVVRGATFLGSNSPTVPSTSDISGLVSGYTTFTVLRMQWDGESLDVTPSAKSSALIPITSTASTINLATRYLNGKHITEKFNSLAQNITVVNSSGVAGFDAGAEIGQIVTTINTTTFNVTLPTLNTVSKVLGQNQIAQRIWDGSTWRYL